jgi:hypothetical protein
MKNSVYNPLLQHAVEQARSQARPIDTLRLEPLSPEPSPSFLPVRITEASQASPASDRTGIEVVLGPGRRIAVAQGFDAENLRRVLAVLESRPC